MENDVISILSYILNNTDALKHISVTFAIGILLGALLLDFNNFWRWLVIFIMFLGLNQWQLNKAISRGNPPGIVILPHLVTVCAALFFTGGLFLGVLIRRKRVNFYTYQEPCVNEVTQEVITKINGG